MPWLWESHPTSPSMLKGSVGYFCAGMNTAGTVRVDGNASTGLAENIMSGMVRISGNATMSAGATGQGGLVVVEGNAGARCGISMKGVDIVVGGQRRAHERIHGTGWQPGRASATPTTTSATRSTKLRCLCGGAVASLGSDCVEQEMTPQHLDTLSRLLGAAAMPAEPADFRLYGSARELYNFHVDDVNAAAAAKGRP